MGLDNGIILRIHKCTDKIAEVFKTITSLDYLGYSLGLGDLESNVNGDFKDIDVCYWRKWWNFRNDLVYRFDMPSNDGRHEVKEDDLIYIRDSLLECIKNPDIFREYTRGYWEFDYSYNQIVLQIARLSWVIKVLFRHDDEELTEEEIEFRNLVAGKWEIYFYDSY